MRTFRLTSILGLAASLLTASCVQILGVDQGILTGGSGGGAANSTGSAEGGASTVASANASTSSSSSSTGEGGGMACADGDASGCVQPTPQTCMEAVCTNQKCSTQNAKDHQSCGKGVCDSGVCVGCIDNSDCKEANAPVCDTTNTIPKCVPASCTDTVQDNDETDKDCGGSCTGCKNNLKCHGPGDCLSDYCNPDGHCALCTNIGNCTAGQFCDATNNGGTCTNAKTNGQPCAGSDGSMCTSGHCVDKVCCDKVCDGPCESCVASGNGNSDGACGTVPSGEDPRGACAMEKQSQTGNNANCHTGTCDGNTPKSCGLETDGHHCGLEARCANQTTQQDADVCGQGTCAPGLTSTCTPNFACSGNVCASTCTSDAQCATGFHCDTATGSKQNTCVACVTDAQCTLDRNAPACGTANTCIACAGNGQCTNNPNGPICNNPPGRCTCQMASHCATSSFGHQCVSGTCGCVAAADCNGIGNGTCNGATHTCG